MRTFLMALAAGLVAGGVSTAAHAERRVALVIGNSTYVETGSLANPRNDAELMARTLESVGFEVTKLIDADQTAMKRAMLDFGRKLRDGAEASLFYYAGHGVQVNGENYLIPVDAAIRDEGEVDLQSINVNDFLGVMENAPSKINIVILDACRNNPFARSFRSASRGLAMVDAPSGTYIAFATAPGQVAADGAEGNSPYTRALAAAMVEPGVKLEDTFKKARRIVIEATSEQQVPWETTSITGDFYFVPATTPSAAALPPPTSAETPDVPSEAPAAEAPSAAAEDEGATEAWKSTAETKDPAELEGFLKRFPNGPFARLARKRIAALQAGKGAAPVIHAMGRLDVPQTYLFDLDQGAVTEDGADVWFEAVTADELYLVPQNGATLGPGDLSKRDAAACAAGGYSSERLPLAKLPAGSFICVRTSDGRTGSFAIEALSDASPRALSINYVTWE